MRTTPPHGSFEALGAERIGVCGGPSIEFDSSLFLAARRIQFDRLVCLADFFAAEEEEVVVREGVGEDDEKVAGTKVVDIRGVEFADGSAGAAPVLQSQWQVIMYSST